MELFDEDFIVNEKTDNKKATTIIMVVIIFLIVMVLLVIGAMIYIKNTTLSVKLNGQETSAIKNMIKIDKDNPQTVYVPIRKISSLLGYSDYSGDYVTKSEEPNQCYVENENEVAMFTLGSRTIYKTLNDGNFNYEYFNINSDEKDAVKSIDGELYTTIDGIEKAFNVSWNYDIEKNKMEIYTMPYLIKYYSDNLSRFENGYYTAVSEDYNNQKAILQNMLVVEKGTDTSKKLGVINVSTGENILEAKYQNIEYLKHTGDFLVTSEEKKGVISNAKKTIVKLQYDDIKLMDSDNKLYLVKNSEKYGVIDFYGQKIIDTDYDEIGIDNSKFKENNIKSKYIIAEKLIPVKSGETWGFFDTKGNQITEFKYDNVGYITTNNRAGSGYNLLVVPKYNVIVVGKGEKYTVMFTDGKEILPMECDSIYMSIYGGETTYRFEYNSNTYSLTEQLDKMGFGTTKDVENSNQLDEEETQENTDEYTEENTEEQTNSEENSNEESSSEENYDENYLNEEEYYDEYYEEE